MLNNKKIFINKKINKKNNKQKNNRPKSNAKVERFVMKHGKKKYTLPPLSTPTKCLL